MHSPCFAHFRSVLSVSSAANTATLAFSPFFYLVLVQVLKILMASGSQLDDGDDADLRNRAVQGLISSLHRAFRDSECAMVERVLAAHKEELKREIETSTKENKWIKEIEAFMVSREGKLRQEIELVNENYEVERLEKIAIEAELENCRKEVLKKKDIEAELKKCRREILELRGQNLRLKAETKRLMKDVNITASLQTKICDLECAKLGAETKASVYKMRYEELERRVFQLEKDTSLLVKLENVEPVGFRNEEVDAVQEESEGHVNFCVENVMLEACDGPSCQSAVNSNENIGNAGSEKPPCRGTVDNTDCALGAALDTEERVADSANICQAGAENGTGVLKRKYNRC
ncbi:uncharacterized protein LOC120001818 [Tripterygium wilfordii]|uniref:uncharacterized protein LOC120001818 n=1 Tax=Tripterygium wilfordii TaxID=458696 RepID=UPI0018F7FEA2|nr:uncharacterized protein LOC120001818 [Tripterygium wilfordii]